MYDYQDYFAQEKKRLPYLTAGEELEDHLRLLDMILENYLEYKGMGSHEKLFSRGLVITESELKAYFDMPPYFRERDICNPVLAASAGAAFDYIADRTAATRQFITEFPENERKSMELGLLRIDYLINTFDLDLKELLAILLAFSVEIDRRYERIYGFFQDNISNGSPTLGLLHALLARMTPRDGAEDTLPLSLDERMYTYFFVRKDDHDSPGSPLILQPLAKRLLMGTSDPAKPDIQVYHQFTEKKNIPLFFEETGGEIAYILKSENAEARPVPDAGLSERLVFLACEDEDTSLHLLYKCCAEKQENLFVLDMKQLLDQTQDQQKLSLSGLFFRMKTDNGRLAIRYSSANTEDRGKAAEQQILLRNFLSEICRVCEPRKVFIFGEKEEPGELAAMLVPGLRIPDPSVITRARIWEYFLKAEKDIRLSKNINIPDLADCYEIPYGTIRKAVGHAAATSRTRQSSTINRKMVLESLRQLNQVDFSGLATYVKPVYTWKDITITEHQREILQTACNRYRLRNRIGEGWGLKHKNAYGNGVSLLLYGPPGTGKTMAAQVVANELDLPLYRVDISQIASKYIGETEKNMAIIFKAAATANVILFFDEADALFAKRTEVSDSHDKFANNETAYLLQKIEEYNGMSILATNYYNNFDDAFVRRITYAVHMESPDKDTRYQLWRTILPKTAKMERNIDFRFLADKFELSGSNIKAILFNAAYMAGAEDKPIGMEHIVRAMQYEYNKLGKLVHGSDFGKYDIYLKE